VSTFIRSDATVAVRRNGMISVTNVPKSVPKRHENDPRGLTLGSFLLVAGTGSGDRIRTCDLWVMS